MCGRSRDGAGSAEQSGCRRKGVKRVKAVAFHEVLSAPRMLEANYVMAKENGKWMLTLARGQCRTGGYDIRLQDVKLNDEGVLKVAVKMVNPEPYAFVTMAITFPVRKYELLIAGEPVRVEVSSETGELLAEFDV